jgi:hypothetical protein
MRKTALRVVDDSWPRGGTYAWILRFHRKRVLVSRGRGRRRGVEYQPVTVIPPAPSWLWTVWFEGRVIFRASLLLTTAVWMRRLFEQFLDRKIFVEAIVNREWDDAIRNAQIDVEHGDNMGGDA